LVENRTVARKSSMEAFTFVRGLDMLNLTKTPLIYTVVFHISLWESWSFVRGAKPNQATPWRQDWLKISFLDLGF